MRWLWKSKKTTVYYEKSRYSSPGGSCKILEGKGTSSFRASEASIPESRIFKQFRIPAPAPDPNPGFAGMTD